MKIKILVANSRFPFIGFFEQSDSPITALLLHSHEERRSNRGHVGKHILEGCGLPKEGTDPNLFVQ
jgi:hypothetical protein